jgi:hypothetical protein
MRVPSQRFGKTIDDAIERADVLSKAGDTSMAKLTVDDVLKIRDNTIAELKESGIVDQAILDKVSSITTKIASEGRKITDDVDFRELLSLKQNIGNELGSSAKQGTKRFGVEDVAMAIFQKNISEPVKTRLGLEGLYKEYSEYVTVSKFIYKHFKPKAGEFDISSTKNFLQNLGIGGKKITGQDLKAMAIIEEGTSSRLYPGIGDVSQKLKDIGSKIDLEKSLSKQNLDRVENFINGKTSQLTSKLSLQKRLNQKQRVNLQMQLATLREMSVAAQTIKHLGGAAGMAILQGAATMAFFKLLFRDK